MPGAQLTGSPSGMGQSAPLPRVDEYANGNGNGNGQRRASGPAHNNGLNPNAHHHQQRLSSSPRPPGTPPMRRQQQQQQPPPQQQQQPPQQQQLPVQPQPAQTPLARPPTKGPQTFAEMGVATTKVEDDSNCVVM